MNLLSWFPTMLALSKVFIYKISLFHDKTFVELTGIESTWTAPAGQACEILLAKRMLLPLS